MSDQQQPAQPIARLRRDASNITNRAVAHLMVTLPRCGDPGTELFGALLCLERFYRSPRLAAPNSPRVEPLKKALKSADKTLVLLNKVNAVGHVSVDILKAISDLQNTRGVLSDELLVEQRRPENGNRLMFCRVFSALRQATASLPGFTLPELVELVLNASDDWIDAPCQSLVAEYDDREEQLRSALAKWMQRAVNSLHSPIPFS